MTLKQIACQTVLCLSTAIYFSAPAHAFELFGKCFGNTCEDQNAETSDIIDPKFYNIDFTVISDTSEEVETSIKSVSELWRGREKPVGGAAGLISRAKSDYKRILAGLYNEGFYAGSISITINGRQASAFKPGDDIPDNSQISVEVNSGAIYQFGQFEISNRAPAASEEDDIVKPPKTLAIESGDIAGAGQVRIASKLAIEEWRQQGHPKARVDNKTVKAIHPEQKLNVGLGIDPGPRAFYGNTQVNGTRKMDPEFVAYMADLTPGEEYDPDDIEKAKKRLDKLDVFSVRKIEEAEQVGKNGDLPIVLNVEEKKQRRFGIGATVSTTDGAGFEAYWLHRNLFGRAERLRVDAEIGGLGETIEVDEFDYKLGLTFTRPGVLSPYTDWTSNIFAEREFHDTFEGESAGGSSTLSHILSNELTLSGGAFVEYSRFQDAFGERNFLSAGLIGSVIYDDRDNSLEPTKGFYASFEAKPFHEFEYENTAIRLDTEVRTYAALDDEADTVLAARAKLGSLLGIARSETPTNFLYFAGGGGSVRGFGFNNIGVIQTNGDIAGGRSLFETSLELRQRFTPTIGGVAFVDAGTVSSDSFIDFSEDLRVSAGIGLRYYTGIGPIRLDVAIPLNPQNGDPDFGVFAGIGQAF